jgi:hypothetical protein
MSFTNFSGGLVDSIAVGAGNSVSTGFANALTGGPVNFSVNSLTAGAVQNVSGYALNSGSNYFLDQVNRVVPTSVGNGLANAVATQVASVGLKAFQGFASQGIQNLFSGNPISGLAPSATANKGTVSVPMSVVDQLPSADYGGSLYTLTDIVFSVVPANAGPQTQPQPQTAPTVPISTAFDSRNNFNPASVQALKGQTAYAFPAAGRTPQFNGASTFVKPAAISTKNIKPLW